MVHGLCSNCWLRQKYGMREMSRPMSSGQFGTRSERRNEIAENNIIESAVSYGNPVTYVTGGWMNITTSVPKSVSC